MSLTARIALQPSREVAWLERAMPLGGLAAAAASASVRWPASAAAIIAAALALAAIGAVVCGIQRPRRGVTLSVSDSSELVVASGAGDRPDGSWRLAEDTVAWPVFALVALRGDAGGELRLPVTMAALRPVDRWALARFLGWSLRSARSADEWRVP